MPSLQWYAHRFAAMSAGEVLYRARQRVSTEYDRWRAARARQWPDDVSLWNGVGGSGAPDWTGWAVRGGGAAARFRLPPSAREGFRARFPCEAHDLLQAADRILQGSLRLFGQTVAPVHSASDWHRDPVSGRAWPPDQFYGDVGFRSGGAKGIWEPARHQHLVTLAQAAWLTGDERYAEALKVQLRSWFDQNRFLRGVHWTSGLELGLRLVSWLWVQALASDRLRDGDLWRDWTRAIVVHADQLRRHESRYSSANNHLVGEAVGLLSAATLVPEWRAAGAWRNRAWAILATEAGRQILPDGAGAEQATHYLEFVLDLCFLALRLEPAHAQTPGVVARLARAAEFLASIRNASGIRPALGDEDGGEACALASCAAPLAARLNLAAAWGGRADLKAEAPALHPFAWWLLPPDRVEAFDALGARGSRPASRACPDGGIWVLRAPGPRERLVVFDCGPLGYLSIAAHGHADALSFCLSVDGEWWLVDPGTYVYHEEPAWRRYFRSTAAHNTVEIGGCDQSVQTGQTMWGRKAQSRIVAFLPDASPAWVEGEHDGYTRLRPPAIHRRGLGLTDEYLVVVDWITPGPWDVVAAFQFAPGTDVTVAGAVSRASRGPRALVMQVLGEVTLTRYQGEDGPPPHGWVSPRFGHRVPAAQVLVRPVHRAAPLVTVFWFSPGDDLPAARLEGHGGRWRVTLPCGTRTDNFDLGAAGDVSSAGGSLLAPEPRGKGR